MKKIMLHRNATFITLGQLLKVTGTIQAGGEARKFLEETVVSVNGERERRRGKKLKQGDRVIIDDADEYLIVSA
jgi:ribosome-associated protein